MSSEVTVQHNYKTWSLFWSHVYVWVSYVVAIVAGGVVAVLLEAELNSVVPGNGTLLTAAIGDVVATIVIWIAGILVQNSSLYDPYWSVIPPVLAAYWCSVAVRESRTVPVARTVLVFVSITVWAIRLTYNWIIGWKTGLAHEDWRYVMIHVNFKRAGLPDALFWVVGSLLGIMMFPTVLVFAGCVPMYFALVSDASESQGFNFLDVFATCIAVSAAALQFISDRQMRIWREEKASGIHNETSMQRGLWRYSRHPNYLGEVTLWWAMFIHALAANLNFWYTIVGAVLMTMLFVFISIPMMEKRSLERRPAYQDVIDSTSMLLLWCPKKVRSQGESSDQEVTKS